MLTLHILYGKFKFKIAYLYLTNMVGHYFLPRTAGHLAGGKRKNIPLLVPQCGIPG